MLPDDELPLSERKRCFGVVFLRAVAAVAGYSTATPESDYDSVDLSVSSKLGKRHRLEFQVKSTAQSTPETSDFAFELSRKNYDDLRADCVIPRLLLVVLVPDSIGDWVRQTERRMNLRRCGYWKSLRGLEDRPNSSTVTVHLSRRDVLTPESLRTLMTQGVT